MINSNLSISFLPWFKIKENIKIGPITFWAYYDENNYNKIKDQSIRKKLDNLFSLFIDDQGKQVDTITICSYEGKHLYELTDSKRKILREIVDSLIFSSIVPQTKTFALNRLRKSSIGGWPPPPTSDIFELFNFPLSDFSEDNLISFKIDHPFGYIIETGELKFHKPYTLTTWLDIDEESKELIKCFDDYFSNRSHEGDDEYNRLVRSLEWYRVANYSINGDIPLARIVMMTTAFEILLKLGNKSQKKDEFAKAVEEDIASKDFRKDTRINNGKKYPSTLVGWWAWDFYKLRNRIVHGENISPEELIYKIYNNKIPHLIVANLIFSEFIIQKLINLDFTCYARYSFGISKKDKKDVVKLLVGLEFGFSKLHEALDWIEEKPINSNT